MAGRAQAQAARVHAPATPVPPAEYYVVQPGDTLTVTQASVPGRQLRIDTSVHTVAPMEVPQGSGCVEIPFGCISSADPVLANDTGVPPVAKDDRAVTNEATAVSVPVLGNDDVAKGAPATITTGRPHHGTVAVIGKVPDQQVRYTPAAGFSGQDSFTYTLGYGTTYPANGTSTATVHVTVHPAPVAAADAATTSAGDSVTVAVEQNDSARGGGTLTITSVGTPAHGTARIVGNEIHYTPDAGFAGTDRFPYVVANAYGTASAEVTVHVDPLAATGAPVAPLTEIGAALLVTGGVVTAAGRRRLRGRHAQG